jgi:hypothetical protein
MSDERELPKYVSHKTVHALEIKVISGDLTVGSIRRTLSFAEAGYAPIEVPIEMFARYHPVPGDFYVVYADGYKSFSPRKAFLEGLHEGAMSDEVEVVTTPVFDTGKQILGYLTHDAAHLKRGQFWLYAAIEPAPLMREVGPVAATYRRFLFVPAMVCSARTDDELSECPVLIVDRAEGIQRLPGFKFFAEVHGKTRLVRRSA